MSTNSTNFFELFELDILFELDLSELLVRYQELQRQTHPDNFATASDSEQRKAVEMSALVNQAYQTLKQPLLRAQYMLGLRGVELADETQTLKDPEFLMQQMEWRETLEGIPQQEDPIAAHDVINKDIVGETQDLLRHIAAKLEDESSELLAVADDVRKLKFFYKLQDELDRIEDSLFD